MTRGDLQQVSTALLVRTMQLSALPETLESLECSAVAEFGIDSGAPAVA